MKAIKKWPVVMALICVLTAFAFEALAENQRPEGKRGHHGPPPEAYAACEGMEAGDRAEFESPRGDTVTGTCVERGGRLVLRPDNPPCDRPPKGEKREED